MKSGNLTNIVNDTIKSRCLTKDVYCSIFFWKHKILKAIWMSFRTVTNIFVYLFYGMLYSYYK